MLEKSTLFVEQGKPVVDFLNYCENYLCDQLLVTGCKKILQHSLHYYHCRLKEKEA